MNLCIIDVPGLADVRVAKGYGDGGSTSFCFVEPRFEGSRASAVDVVDFGAFVSDAAVSAARDLASTRARGWQ